MHVSFFSLGPSRGYQFLILTFYVPLVGPRTFMRYNVPAITWLKHQSELSANSSRQNKRQFCAFRQVKSTYEVGVECQKNATGEGYAYRYVTSLYNLVSGPLDPEVICLMLEMKLWFNPLTVTEPGWPVFLCFRSHRKVFGYFCQTFICAEVHALGNLWRVGKGGIKAPKNMLSQPYPPLPFPSNAWHAGYKWAG